ncbi:glycosyltransferase family 2 protein [Arthrobacter sp. Y81]|uniref:glycosyltransferase family 2 protein n=1 Tax=Arthrobacter sp. Y81 TaxID=2058897 RepID=UPI000CE2B8E4|nr:glycosyltransferase [Arthrobacter sp. Y81]
MTTKLFWSKVNIVCVTFNNEATVEPLLRNLAEQSEWIEQVVVHDNGSGDDTVARVEAVSATCPDLTVTIIRADNVGFGQGIFGACQGLSDGELPTLCLNPDAVLSAGTVEKMLDTLNSDPLIGVVTAPLVRADGQLDSASVRKLPRFGSSLLYSAVGKLVPKRFRYNATTIDDLESGLPGQKSPGHSVIEATTGALMLVNPQFRPSTQPIFDLEYWMYGEDLQLCKDAADEGYQVVIIDWPASLHLKGVSSGWPRGRTSNKAFHDALFLYYAKNMSRSWADRALARAAVSAKFTLSQAAGDFARRLKLSSRS